MYPGPDDPDLGVFVRQLELALRVRGHEIELAVLDRRGGRQAPVSRAARARSAPPARPDVVWAHFLVPAGLIASSVDAPLVVTAHGRDVRNVGAVPGVAALTRRVVERASTVITVSDYLRRELELKLPEARGKTVVIDSGVDLERFAVDGAERRGGAARVRVRRQPHRAEERRPARRRLRRARARQPGVRRRRAAPAAARGPRARARRRARPARRGSAATSRPPMSSARPRCSSRSGSRSSRRWRRRRRWWRRGSEGRRSSCRRRRGSWSTRSTCRRSRRRSRRRRRFPLRTRRPALRPPEHDVRRQAERVEEVLLRAARDPRA